MRSKGKRSGTRKLLKKSMRRKGAANITTLLHSYKNGDYVDIKLNPTYNKSLIDKVWHGRTGRVFKVDERTIGVKVKRIIGNKEVEERLDIRPEHLKPSRCREEFLKRSHEYNKKRLEAIEKGLPMPSAKRVMPGPRGEIVVSRVNNEAIRVGYSKFVDSF